MATNNLQETLKKTFFQGVGLAAQTAEVLQKSVGELIRKGKVSEAEGKRIIHEAVKKIDAKRPEIESKYNEALHKFIKLTNAEIDKAQKQISKLESQLKINKGGATKSVAKPVAKKKAVKRKPAAKKPAATPPAA